MQSARVGLGVEWLCDDRIVAVGGKVNSEQRTATVEMLERPWGKEEPANSGWRYVAPMNHARWLHAVAFFIGKIIAAGGDKRESVECFTLPNAELFKAKILERVKNNYVKRCNFTLYTSLVSNSFPNSETPVFSD